MNIKSIIRCNVFISIQTGQNIFPGVCGRFFGRCSRSFGVGASESFFSSIISSTLQKITLFREYPHRVPGYGGRIGRIYILRLILIILGANCYTYFTR